MASAVIECTTALESITAVIFPYCTEQVSSYSIIRPSVFPICSLPANLATLDEIRLNVSDIFWKLLTLGECFYLKMLIRNSSMCKQQSVINVNDLRENKRLTSLNIAIIIIIIIHSNIPDYALPRFTVQEKKDGQKEICLNFLDWQKNLRNISKEMSDEPCYSM